MPASLVRMVSDVPLMVAGAVFTTSAELPVPAEVAVGGTVGVVPPLLDVVGVLPEPVDVELLPQAARNTSILRTRRANKANVVGLAVFIFWYMVIPLFFFSYCTVMVPCIVCGWKSH